MEVRLLNPDDKLVFNMSLACDTCVSKNPKGSEDLQKVIRVLRAGHLSIAEHINLSFEIKGVSRVLMAQLTRHRHASFSIQSQRSVFPEGIVVPDSIKESQAAMSIFMQTYEALVNTQQLLAQMGIPKEDARYLSPEGSKTNIMLSGNLRAFIEMSQKRLCLQAQKEIRDLFIEIRKILVKTYGPWLKEFLSPPCDRCKDMRPCQNRST